MWGLVDGVKTGNASQKDAFQRGAQVEYDVGWVLGINLLIICTSKSESHLALGLQKRMAKVFFATACHTKSNP